MDRRSYNFTKKPPSKEGQVSSLLSLASFLLFAAAVILSWADGGSAGISVGGLAFAGVLLSAYAFYVGMRSLRESEASPVLSLVGSISGGVMTVIYLTVFLSGIV